MTKTMINTTAASGSVMSVFEHQRLSVQDFTYASDFSWLLAQELPAFTIKCQRGQWQLKVSHYLGVILLPSHITLEILPKTIGKSLSAKSDQTSQLEHIIPTRQWVERMLSTLINASDTHHNRLPHSQYFGQASAQLTPLPLANLPLSQWLLEQFLQLLSRYQPSMHYQTQMQNQAALQGKLLIKEQLRYNSYQPHKFVSEVSTLSVQTLSNRLIKSALQLIEPLLSSPVLPMDLLAWHRVTALSLQEQRQLDSLYASAKQQLSRQPLPRQQQQAAQQLLAFGYWLLRTQAATVPVGNGLNKSHQHQPAAEPTLRLCLLLNMNQAFEQWVSLQIAASFAKLQGHYRPVYQAQHVWLTDQLGQAQLSMRPDLLIYQQPIKTSTDSEARRHCSQVIDIKWKLLAKAGDISASDAYQLSSYAQAYQPKQVWLVYPVTDSSQRPIALHRQLDRRFERSTHLIPPAKNQTIATAKRAEAALWLMPFDVFTGQLLLGDSLASFIER